MSAHRQHVYVSDSSEYTITTPVIPYDTPTPLVTEGVEIFSQSFTPTAADSVINIEFGFTASAVSFTSKMAIAVFEDSTCIGVGAHARLANDMEAGVYRTRVVVSDTNARTFSVRVGVEAQTLYLNRTDSAGEGLGGSESMWLEINEVAP